MVIYSNIHHRGATDQFADDWPSGSNNSQLRGLGAIIASKTMSQHRTSIDRNTMPSAPKTILSRRDLLAFVGTLAGSAAMYHAMTALGFASESPYKGRIKLEGDIRGTSVLILGAGLAGMTAALELRNAGYAVQVLEFSGRPGGRNWTLRGGDKFEELGGFTQTCDFAPGLYFNPGPWRIPYHHRAVLDYCKRLNVEIQPFVQLNHNALLHSSNAFEGRPQRIRHIRADFQGQIAELLAKVTEQAKLDEAVSADDKAILLEALRSWGALDKDYAYNASLTSASSRGFSRGPGGGLNAVPTVSDPVNLSEILRSRLWRYLQNFARYEFQSTMFQPVGGMDAIGRAFAKEIGALIQLDSKVTRIEQDDGGVRVTYQDNENAREYVCGQSGLVCLYPFHSQYSAKFRSA
jgi:monoamine oxidase